MVSLYAVLLLLISLISAGVAMNRSISVSKLMRSFFRIIILCIIFISLFHIIMDQSELNPKPLPIHNNIHHDLSRTVLNIMYEPSKHELNSLIQLQSSRLFSLQDPLQCLSYDYICWPCACAATDSNDMQYHPLSLSLSQQINVRQSVYKIQFVDDTDDSNTPQHSLCGKQPISSQNINKIIELIDRDFIYEMWIDMLPMYAPIGFISNGHYYLYTHREFNIHLAHDESFIVTANIVQNSGRVQIERNVDLDAIEFTYSVRFLKTKHRPFNGWKEHVLLHGFETNKQYITAIAVLVQEESVVEYFTDVNAMRINVVSTSNTDVDEMNTDGLELPGNLARKEANYSMLTPQELEENGQEWKLNDIYPELKDRLLSTCGDATRYYTTLDADNALRYYDKVELWPIPQKFRLFPKNVVVESGLKWTCNCKMDDVLRSAIDRYDAMIFEHRVDHEMDEEYYFDAIKLVIDDLSDRIPSQHMNEWYEIIIPYDNNACHTLFIHSKSVFGALRGIESMSQLIYYDFDVNTYMVKYVGYILDYPYFPYRGVLLDTSRHFQPPTVIKHFVDSISFAKFNVFHWHMVDDHSWPFPIVGQNDGFNLSDLYEKGSWSKQERYSAHDIKDIIRYANVRGIRVIPEFDVPGHVGAWCKAFDICLDVSCHHSTDGVLDPSKPLTFGVVEAVYDAIVEMFNDSYLHIGNDEANYQCFANNSNLLKWFNDNDVRSMKYSVKRRKIRDGVKINAYTVDRLFEIFARYNRTLISWDDLYSKVKGVIPKDVILMVWQPRWQKDVAKMLRDGYTLIITAPFYVDRWYEPLTDRYFADLWPKKTAHLSAEMKRNIIGGEACLWSENVDGSVLDAKLWPDAAATAENLWMGPSKIKTLVPLWHYVIKDRLKWYRCFMMQRGIGFMQIDVERKYPSDDFYLREPMFPFSCFDELDVRPIEQILPDNDTRKARREARAAKLKANAQRPQLRLLNHEALQPQRREPRRVRTAKTNVVVKLVIGAVLLGFALLSFLSYFVMNFDNKSKSF
eukprot:273351_1